MSGCDSPVTAIAHARREADRAECASFCNSETATSQGTDGSARVSTRLAGRG